VIIICPNCSTSFGVPDEVIPDAGRSVKCSKCANIWHVKKPEEPIRPLETTQTEKPIEKDATPSNLPIIHETESHFQWIFSFFALMVISSFITFIIYFEPITSDPLGEKIIYSLGFSDTKHFAIQDIRIRTAKYSGKYAIYLKYRIYNNSSEVQNTPWVRIKFFDKENKLFYTHIGTNSRFKFQEFQNVPTRAEFKDLSSEVSRIEIALGNKIELYSR
jgi:predicted Zn finger-like uncharacterized protein